MILFFFKISYLILWSQFLLAKIINRVKDEGGKNEKTQFGGGENQIGSQHAMGKAVF